MFVILNLTPSYKVVIPAPDKYFRGQAPAGIYTPTVIPAKAGIYNYIILLDSRFHGNDKQRRNLTFYGFVIHESGR